MTKNKWEAAMPKKIRVACFDIAIVQWTLVESASQSRFGEFSAAEQNIRICPGHGRFKAVDTLLHEIGHAIYWAYGIEDEDKEERTVSAQGTAWTQVFRDNPQLLKFLSVALHGK